MSCKCVAGFGGLGALVGGVSAFTVARVSFLDQSAEWTTHTYGVLGGIDDALLGIVNQETGLRGFLVAGKEELIEPYKNGPEQYNSAFARVQALTSATPEQPARLPELNRFAKHWQNQVAETEIENGRASCRERVCQDG